jgi:hypothetical protein
LRLALCHGIEKRPSVLRGGVGLRIDGGGLRGFGEMTLGSEILFYCIRNLFIVDMLVTISNCLVFGESKKSCCFEGWMI